MNANIKRLLSLFLLGGIAAQGNAQAVGTPYIPMIDIPFSFLYGGVGIDSPRTNNFVISSDGSYYGIGDTTSSASGDVTGTNGGARDFWVVKWDKSGKILWQKIIGGTGTEAANNSITATSDGGCFIVAAYGSNNIPGSTFHGGNSDLLAAKLDASGNIQWQRLIGGSGNDQAVKVIQTADGEYIMAGVSFSVDGDLTGVPKYTGGAFGTDAWVIKLTATGAINWQKRYGGTDEDSMAHILQTADGGYIVAGNTSSPANGDFTGLPVYPGSNSYLMKLDASGNRIWIKRFGVSAAANIYVISMNPTSDGGNILAIRTGEANTGTLAGIPGFGSNDFWIMKTDASGNIMNQKVFGGTGSDVPTSIQQMPDGGYIVSGGSASSNTGSLTGYLSHGGFDSWVVKLDASLNITQQRLYGGTGNDGSSGSFILQDTDGGFILLSDSASSGSFDVTDTNHAAGSADYWLLKLLPSGEILWTPDIGQR